MGLDGNGVGVLVGLEDAVVDGGAVIVCVREGVREGTGVDVCKGDGAAKVEIAVIGNEMVSV